MPDNFVPPYHISNPSFPQRYEMVKYLLDLNKRPEDINNIFKLLSPPPDILSICPKNHGKQTRVAIIGAGDAGLSAAYELRKIGCDITIFEASNRIGGRIYTYYFDKNKYYFGDLGAMRLSPSHQCSWHYVNKFKLQTKPFASSNINGRFYIRGVYAQNDSDGRDVMKKIYPRFNLTPEEKRTPWRDLLGRIVNKYLTLIPSEARKELIEIKPNYSEYINIIDRLSYRQAYESVGLSEDAITMLGYLSQFEAIFFPLALTEVLQEAYTVDFGYNYYIEGGMTNLPMAFFHSLTNKINTYNDVSTTELGRITFKINSSVEGVYCFESGRKILLHYRNTKNNECLTDKFDYVICAIPFSSLRRIDLNPLFTVRKMQAIRELNYEDGHKTFLFLKNRFWEQGISLPPVFGGNNSNDLPLISTFYPSDHASPVPGKYNAWTLAYGKSPCEPGVLLASYNWVQEAARLGNEQPELLISDVLRYVEKTNCLPCGYLNDKLISSIHINWQDVQYIWGGSCLGKVLDKLVFSHAVTMPEMNERVFFAGEHISQKHGWQQGSFQTAMIAANEVAKRIKYSKV